MRLHRIFPLLVLTACGGTPTDTTITLTADDVAVNSVLPAEAGRGISVALRILGSGFDAGSLVSFAFGDLTTDAITVDSVRFVSATELKAFATIKPGAPLGRYGVRIVTGRGSRGRGNEKFRTLVDMETLGFGWAYAINSSGNIAGFTSHNAGTGPAFASSKVNGSPTTDLPGATQFSYAYDITDADLIVGVVGEVPVRWNVPGLRRLEPLFPATSADWTFIVGEAKRANESGLIVGWVNPNQVPGGAQRSFCWRATGWTIVPPTDANYLGSGVPWDVNEAGDAVGRILRQTPAISEAFVLHCHAGTPSITILSDPAQQGALAHAIGDDGTVYGQVGGLTVRWRQIGPDQWGLPETMAGVPFLPQRVTAGGRLVGGADGFAYLWDSSFGLIPLSAGSDGTALAWFARDNGPGTLVVDVVGTASGEGSAVHWRVELPRP